MPVFYGHGASYAGSCPGGGGVGCVVMASSKELTIRKVRLADGGTGLCGHALAIALER